MTPTDSYGTEPRCTASNQKNILHFTFWSCIQLDPIQPDAMGIKRQYLKLMALHHQYTGMVSCPDRLNHPPSLRLKKGLASTCINMHTCVCYHEELIRQ